MNKDTIELKRTKDFPYNYGRGSGQPTEGDFLDALVEWSKKNEGKKIYKHLHRTEQENVDNNRVYKYFFYGQIISKEEYEDSCKRGADVYFVPYCELVDYLDIYFQ
jgi:hypothetical protein